MTMSLRTRISIKENSNSITVFDCTGNYSADNKEGYGIPNYKISDVKEAILSIQSPSDTKAYPHEIDVTGDLPNIDQLGLEILPSQVGQSNDEIESGQWKFTLKVSINTKNGTVKTFTAYATEILIKSIECCVDKNTAKLDHNAFSDPRQKKTIELSTLLQDVKYQIESGRYDHASKTIEYLKFNCKCSGC